MRFLVIFFVLTCFSISVVIGQTKKEREERIPIEELPRLIQNLIPDLPLGCKRVKFYKETDGNKSSFEIKLKYKHKKFSIEFNKDGILEDIEITASKKDIANPVNSYLKSYFDSKNEKYKLLKIQKQYLYKLDDNSLDFILNTLELKNDTLPNYEIITEIKKGKKITLKELLISSEGKLLEEREIEPDLYDHVMY